MLNKPRLTDQERKMRRQRKKRIKKQNKQARNMLMQQQMLNNDNANQNYQLWAANSPVFQENMHMSSPD